jgi:hypothetical protein
MKRAISMRGVLAVIAGLVVSAALMIGTNLLLVNVIASTSATFLIVTLVCAGVYKMTAGYVCAAISRDSWRATVVLVVLGTAMLLSSVVQTWALMPRWYSIVMTCIAPTALWFGARAHARRAFVPVRRAA